LFIDEERIGQKRRKKINHFNQFFDASGGNPSSGGGGFFGSFGDGSSSSWSFGIGGGGATGSGHGNMHSYGGSADNYGNQQQYHSMGTSHSSLGAHSHPLPPVSSMFGGPPQRNYHPMYSPMNQFGIRDRSAKPEVVKSENDSMGMGKCLLYIN